MKRGALVIVFTRPCRIKPVFLSHKAGIDLKTITNNVYGDNVLWDLVIVCLSVILSIGQLAGRLG